MLDGAKKLNSDVGTCVFRLPIALGFQRLLIAEMGFPLSPANTLMPASVVMAGKPILQMDRYMYCMVRT